MRHLDFGLGSSCVPPLELHSDENLALPKSPSLALERDGSRTQSRVGNLANRLDDL